MHFQDDLRRVVTRANIQRCLVVCCLPAALFYLGAVLVMSLAGFSLLETLRDGPQITQQSSWLGFVSSVGSWLWVSAAAISLFRASVQHGDEDGTRRFVLILGGFSLWLAIDDFFLIHDRYIAEGLLIPLYAIFLITLLLRHHERIARIDGMAFLTAGAMLAMSAVVDSVQENLPVPYRVSQFFEEGFKFLGAAAWLYFCVRVAAYRLGPVAAPDAVQAEDAEVIPDIKPVL